MQVWVLGYGFKSRCWAVSNPFQEPSERVEKKWTWDVGRSVRATDADSIPLFGLDADDPHGPTMDMMCYEMMGTNKFMIYSAFKGYCIVQHGNVLI